MEYMCMFIMNKYFRSFLHVLVVSNKGLMTTNNENYPYFDSNKCLTSSTVQEYVIWWHLKFGFFWSDFWVLGRFLIHERGWGEGVNESKSIFIESGIMKICFTPIKELHAKRRQPRISNRLNIIYVRLHLHASSTRSRSAKGLKKASF